MIAADAVTGTTWRFRGITPSPETLRWPIVGRRIDAVRGLASRQHHTTRNHRPVQHEPPHALRLRIRRGRAGARGSGLVTIGTGLLIDHAFDLWNLRKIYFEVPEYNLDQLGGLAKLTVEEGRLRDHEEMHGRHWDHFIYALYQERWPEISQRLLGLPPR